MRVVDLRSIVVRNARHDELRAGFLEEILVAGSEGGGRRVVRAEGGGW